MSGRKIQPHKIFTIHQIHQGFIKEMLDQKFFMIGEEPVAKVLTFGVVIEKRDFTPPEKRRFISLRIDDGTDTIGLTVWSYPKNEYGDPIEMVEDIEIGDIVEVSGRVRDYNDELFISPKSVIKKDGIEWEIYKRTQILKVQMEEVSLFHEEQLIFHTSIAEENENETIGETENL